MAHSHKSFAIAILSEAMKYSLTYWLNKRTFKKSSQGFTLMELLVVIMIIGILSSIALSSFFRFINLAKETEGKTNLKNLVKLNQEHQIYRGKFSADPESLGSNLPTETENYSYSILVENNLLNGALHMAKSKHPFLRSYIQVIYYKDSEIKECGPKSVDLNMLPFIIVDAIANPKKYCP